MSHGRRVIGAALGMTLGLLAFAAAPDESRAEGTDSSVIASPGEAAFAVMLQAMRHPRCLNCHTSDDTPRRGMESQPHRFGVRRGADGSGVPGFRCAACHREGNFDAAGVPGAHGWALAPRTAGWNGLEPFAICFALVDAELNGGRSPAEIKRHVETDPLVRWSWSPGLDPAGVPRETPPVGYDAFVDAVGTWVRAGTPCP